MRDTWIRWLCVGLFSLLVGWIRPIEAIAVPLYYVQAQATASSYVICCGPQQNSDTGQIQASFASAGPVYSSSYSSGIGSAEATASGSASLGSLHGYGTYSVSGYDAGGAGSGTERWGDTFTVGGLPQWTPVTLRATLTVHGVLTGDGALNLYASAVGPWGTRFIQRNGNVGVFTEVLSWDFTSYIGGSPFSVDGLLNFYAGGSVNGGGLSGTVDVSNTSSFTLDVLTPGATYTTASGMSYSAVPEPATMLLVGSGLAGLGWCGRKRRKSDDDRQA